MQQGRTTRAPSSPELTPERKPLSLRLYPDSVLRTQCEPVDRFDAWLADVFEEMLALMRNHKGIGLAGPQAGLTKRLFVAEIEGQTLRVANPVIHVRGGQDRMVEGCLSLPEMQVEMDRALQVEMRGYDVQGKKRKQTAQGLWARVMQHEVDHLNGVLICDYQERPLRRNRETHER
jgi:peptide deformylase